MRFKKLLSVVLSVTMLGTSSAIFTANAEETTSYNFGDVNFDGKVNIDDLNKLQDYIFDEFEPTADNTAVFSEIADINKDGNIDDKDVDAFVDAFIYAGEHRGDVNEDKELSILDATEIQKYLARLATFDNISSFLKADANGDGLISILDVTEIQKNIAKLCFPTQAIKDADAKYRGTYDAKTGKYKGGEYCNAINYIEETTDISFDWLLKNEVYIVKAPNGYSSHTKYDSVWVRDKDWCYEISFASSPESSIVWLWSCYSNNETAVLPVSLAGYKVEVVSDWFSEKEEFPNYPTEQSTIDSIKTLIIPNTNGYMDFCFYCFQGMKGLENVVIQEGVERRQLGTHFLNCENLKNIIWPDSLTKIPGGFFAGCKSIKSIQQLHLPSTVNEIGATLTYGTFEGSGLEEITIPEHIRTIKWNAFHNVPARKVTFLYKDTASNGIVNYDFEPYIFNMSGTFLGEKYTFYGYNNATYASIKKDIMNVYDPEYGDVLPSFNYISE